MATGWLCEHWGRKWTFALGFLVLPFRIFLYTLTSSPWVLVGLQGTAGNVAGMVSPVLGGAIVARTGSWDLNFYLLAALLAGGLIVWARWASGEPINLPPPRP